MQKNAIVDEKLAELVKVAAPYLYFLKCKNCIALDKIIKIAVSDSDVINLLPKESKSYQVAGPQGAYYSPQEEYLREKIFTRNNVDDAAKIPNTNDVRPKEQPNECNFIQGTPEKKNVTNYSCVMTDDMVENINPDIFFQSSQFLDHSSADGVLTVDFKSEAMRDTQGVAVRLSFIKNNGLVSKATTYDYRESLYKDRKDKYTQPGTSSSDHILTEDELIKVNRKYIKRLYVVNGGELYKPQQNHASANQKQLTSCVWYNPLTWICKLFSVNSFLR